LQRNADVRLLRDRTSASVRPQVDALEAEHVGVGLARKDRTRVQVEQLVEVGRGKAVDDLERSAKKIIMIAILNSTFNRYSFHDTIKEYLLIFVWD
jgi:hypothetical protein